MKVGILTFHLGPNFGGYLQAYCLACAIRQLGHEAEIINYKNRIHWQSNRFQPWVYRRPGRLWHDFIKHRTFERAFGQLPLSRFTTDPAQVEWNRYDAIVIGSDIVWNCEFPAFGRDPVYFGRFPVPYRGRLIAYAPSIGPMNPEYPAPAGSELRRFHFIGVRDVNTQTFVEHQVGIKPALVVDPTWLIEKEDGAARVYPRRTEREFLLVYSFPLEGRQIDEARSFARKQGLWIAAVGYWQGWCDQNWATVDPFEWVQLIREARYVLSGTFHGTLYSIREKTPFCLLANEGSDSKVSTMLSAVGLQHRRTSDPSLIERILLEPVDYNVVGSKLDAMRRQSLSLLKQALS